MYVLYSIHPSIYSHYLSIYLSIYLHIHSFFYSSLQRSQQALDVACSELRNILNAVNSTVSDKELPSILAAIYMRKDAVTKQQTELCLNQQ